MTVAGNSRSLRIILLMLIVMLLHSFTYGKVIYVDENANRAKDGSSWIDAYPCLQNALMIAQPRDEILVAQGIYKPDRQIVTGRNARIVASGDRTVTFQLKNGVAIKGGYAGTGELDPDTRDIKLYETILSGDLDGNDGPNFTNNSKNSYHVVTGTGANPTAIINGFTVTGGNANGLEENFAGSGMYNKSGSPTVTDCTFTVNSADTGGGISNDFSSSPNFTNCRFSGNSATVGGGDGQYQQQQPNGDKLHVYRESGEQRWRHVLRKFFQHKVNQLHIQWQPGK